MRALADSRRRSDLDRACRAVEKDRRLRGIARAAADAAGAARPDRSAARCSTLAGEIGGRSISSSTPPIVIALSASPRAHGVEVAQLEMDTNYFGLLRLAQEFAPAMRRAARTASRAPSRGSTCFPSLRLPNFPPHGTYSASKAAALSLAQCLRAELEPAGVRVINVFPGPIDDEWNQALPPPKIAPAGSRRHRRGAAGRGRGCLPGRHCAGLAGAHARQPEGAGARTWRGELYADE